MNFSANIIEQEIKNVCKEAPKQMSFDERMLIYKTICENNCKNMLVFGTGYDSKLWSSLCSNVVFLENNLSWIQKIKRKFEDTKLQIYVSDYYEFSSKEECLLAIEQNDENKLLVQVRGIDLFETQWDILIVDAPTGFKKSDHFRAGSIRLASQLASLHQQRDRCRVFVHDINRHIEQTSVKKFFMGRHRERVDNLEYIL